MSKKKMSLDEQRLTQRYLLWCYKTTKEELERIDRKFTQLEVDYFVLKHLQSQKAQKVKLSKKIDGFKDYIKNKEKMAQKEKFGTPKGKEVDDHYLYLEKRLSGIEKAITHFCGKKELDNIKSLYQEEFVNRILTAREH